MFKFCGLKGLGREWMGNGNLIRREQERVKIESGKGNK